MMDDAYWLCDGTCGVPMGHAHYGENVVLPFAPALTPAQRVADELLAVVKRTLSLFEAMAVDLPEIKRLRELVGRAEK